MAGRRLTFDIEGNSLYLDITKVHCIRVKDEDSGEVFRFDKDHEPIFKGIELLNNEEDTLIGHNIINFDIPALGKLYPQFKWKKRKTFDTLLMAKFCFTDIEKTDLGRIVSGKLPKSLYAKHSLKAWGYRLGDYKGDYGERLENETDEEYMERVWANYCPEMAKYCEQDVHTTSTLYSAILRRIKKDEIPKSAYLVEHRFAEILSRQQRHGVYFNIDKAERLERELRIEATKALDECLNTYKPKWFIKGKQNATCIVDGKKYPCFEAKANRGETITTPSGDTIKVTGKVKGALFNNIELITFNPNSGSHIIKWLVEDFDWQPTEFTEKGNPKTDGDTLGSLTFEGIAPLQTYQMLTKRLSQLADGEGSLLNRYNSKTHRMYGYVDTIGAVSRRCTHSSPNLAQIPASKHDKKTKKLLYGLEGGYSAEFRELFTVPKGYKLVGADASGLELRTLSHYLFKFDKGEYAEVVLNGDIHTKNQEDAELDTRDNAKTFIYAFLYGAGEVKLGEIVLPNASLADKKARGKKLKQKFMANNPNIKLLSEAVKTRAEARGYVLDIDGKKLFIRSVHSALNLLLQSCGAIVMKYWLCNVDDVLEELGLLNSDDVRHLKGVLHDFEFVLNVHDEAQLEVKEDKAEIVEEALIACFNLTGEQLGLNIRIDGEAKIGDSWADTH